MHFWCHKLRERETERRREKKRERKQRLKFKTKSTQLNVCHRSQFCFYHNLRFIFSMLFSQNSWLQCAHVFHKSEFSWFTIKYKVLYFVDCALCVLVRYIFTNTYKIVDHKALLLLLLSLYAIYFKPARLFEVHSIFSHKKTVVQINIQSHTNTDSSTPAHTTSSNKSQMTTIWL